MNNFANAVKDMATLGITENGAITRTTTGSAVYDLFALGSAYRTRSDDDCIFLFKKAFEEDEKYALKCLFYIRDCREGQGERRFFRTCLKWLAQTNPDAVKRNLKYIPEFGRVDDLYCLLDTPCQDECLKFIKELIGENLAKYDNL